MYKLENDLELKKTAAVPEQELCAGREAASRLRERLLGRDLTYFIETYGCQMNEHDSEKLAGMLEACGFAKSETKFAADAILFNTCCVREHAEKRLMGNVGALKKLKDERPGLLVCVCGCMAQQEGVADKLYKRFPFVDLIFGTHELHLFPQLLEEAMEGRRLARVRDLDGEIAEGLPVLRNSGVSQFVTIMYGCDNFCSYCIVPYVRGRERSRQPERILAEIRALAAGGVKEITLLGQNVNSYRGVGEIDFPELLRMASEIEGIARIRFMTSHPKDLSARLVGAIAALPKVCPHIHLPVQSGSDRVLALMNRGYTSKDYLALVANLRKAVPGIEITTDFIVGFPGEMEEDFLNSLRLAREAGFSAAYTFKYSKRGGTKAADMEGQVPEDVKKERLKRLNDAVAEGLRAGNEKYIGMTGEVLVEGCDRRGNAMAFGKLPSFKMAYFPGDESLIGRLIRVNITKTSANSLIGERAE